MLFSMDKSSEVELLLTVDCCVVSYRSVWRVYGGEFGNGVKYFEGSENSIVIPLEMFIARQEG